MVSGSLCLKLVGSFFFGNNILDLNGLNAVAVVASKAGCVLFVLFLFVVVDKEGGGETREATAEEEDVEASLHLEQIRF